MPIDLATLSSHFKAIADPQRLRILHLLARAELSVGELVRILDLPQSTVSRQLKPLKEQGLVVDRPVGSATYYQATQQTEHDAGEAALRGALLHYLREAPMSRGDQERLDRLIALRSNDSGEEFFDRIGLRWDALRENCFGPSFHLEAFLRLLPREWTVADLGTGTGYLLTELAPHFKRVIGVDMSQPMLDLAARRIADARLANVDLRQGKLEKLPLKSGEAHLAVCVLMLHHLEAVPPALSEIFRILKAEGRLLIVELHPHENERFRAAMADRRPGIDPQQMRQWLENTGFAEVELWDYPLRAPTDQDLTPIPPLYGVVAKKGQ